MKIVLPVHHFPPRYTAGAELYTFRLARWLHTHGHDVEIVCVEHVDWRSEKNDLSVIQDNHEDLTVWRVDLHITADRWWPRNYDNPLLGEWFANYLAESQPDLVHFQAGYLIGSAPLRATHAAGIPNALTLHDYWFLCPRTTLQRGDGSLCTKIPDDPAGCAWCMKLEGRRYRLAHTLTQGLASHTAGNIVLQKERDQIARRRINLRSALALPDAVIVPSRFLGSQFASYVDAERLHVSKLGIDLTPFHGIHHGPSDDVLRIGFTGQIAQHKGVHVLIEAFGNIEAGKQPIELHIYGGLDRYPQYVSRLRRMAANDERIFFHGRFENRDVASILHGLDVNVVPSTWYENSPLSILESHAAGTPVVTSAMGGMAELVRDGVDGLHFQPNDVDDLTKQLQRLINEPMLLEQIRVGVPLPRSIDDEMQQLLNIYRSLVIQPDQHLQGVI